MLAEWFRVSLLNRHDGGRGAPRDRDRMVLGDAALWAIGIRMKPRLGDLALTNDRVIPATSVSLRESSRSPVGLVWLALLNNLVPGGANGSHRT